MFPINCLAWLAAAYRDNHLQPVAISQLLCSKLAARHNLAVAFQRDAFAAETQIFDEGGDANGIW